MKTAIIYGKGKFYSLHADKIRADYKVVGFLDSWHGGEFEGSRCYKICAYQENEDIDFYIVMTADFKMLFEMLNSLLSLGIDPNKIKIGYFEYESRIKDRCSVMVNKNGSMSLKVDGIEIMVNNASELSSVQETIICRAYEFFINNTKKNVIFDIGANIGDSALYFLNKDDTELVLSYEPFDENYARAKANLSRYINTSRLQLNNYGISNRNEYENIEIYKGMGIGLSTDFETLKRNEALLKYCMDDKKKECQCIELRNISDVVSPIIEKYKAECNIVLKIDCEGEEFAIIGELNGKDLLRYMDLIMLEWHYHDEFPIIEALRNNGFSYVLQNKTSELGLIWAWKEEGKRGVEQSGT